MVSRFLLIFILSVSQSSTAQEEYIQPGLLAASITYSPSIMLNYDENNFYVTGFAEYLFDEHFSFRSDTYVFLNGEKDISSRVIKDGVRSYFGVAYHLHKGNWDGSIGLQPGLTIMNQSLVQTSPRLIPSAAIRIGTTYYVWKYFNFFANLTYTRSKLVTVFDGSIPTDELIFSAGLGFQIQTKK